MFMDDGSQYVVGPNARMVGLPDGSIRIDGPVRQLRRARKKGRRQPSAKSVTYTTRPNASRRRKRQGN